jgi:SAM-dependent methyltransferase
MVKIVIHCPINCEEFCQREIIENTIPSLEGKYILKIIDRGCLTLDIFTQSSKELKYWTTLLSNCYTIEKLRLEIQYSEISSDIQKFEGRKPKLVGFLEVFFENALTKLLQISSPFSVTLIINMQYWRDFSQREIQGIFKRVAQKHVPPLQFLMKEADLELHASLTKHHLKITMDLPIQASFFRLKVHPTPVFPSVAYVMLKLGLQQLPQASRFVDAMCGAGNIALIIARVLKDKKSLIIGAFDKDIHWIEVARENSRILQTPEIKFSVFDLLKDDIESTFPYRDCDIFLSHPPYSHFVQYSNESLTQLYQNLLQVFQIHTKEQGCLVLNTPRDDIVSPLLKRFSLIVVHVLEIPRKTTTVKLWVLIKKNN